MTGYQLMELGLVDEALLMDLFPSDWSLETKQRNMLPTYSLLSLSNEKESDEEDFETALSQYWLFFPPIVSCQESWTKCWEVVQSINKNESLLQPIQVVISEGRTTHFQFISYHFQQMEYLNNTVYYTNSIRNTTMRRSTNQEMDFAEDDTTTSTAKLDELLFYFKSGLLIERILKCHEVARKLRPDECAQPVVQIVCGNHPETNDFLLRFCKNKNFCPAPLLAMGYVSLVPGRW